ncbi:Plant organelle RNA recognition domain containing protein [Parasponia andersonii]|uniref:Plant organelle RNA recognition domain containing protein n=1 Tax=Parasponia andersonii TaxID=3476 RepID=A0A2P5CSH6_PARAD|nr:Plant organelle RNA recognition domain containing protein [Parasponia andersonii]
MAISLPFSTQGERPITFLNSDFFPRKPAACFLGNIDKIYKDSKIPPDLSVSISCSIIKTVRSPCLDRHIVKQNKIRFVQKLKTLLLSKPKHYIPLHILSKCRSYLSLSTPKSILSMIRRYPTIFELFAIPWPPIPLNATKSYPQLCVRLTPAASALAAEELNYKSAISDTLAGKLQKLLMLSSHQRLLLSKLVHLAPDLGLPPNFRSRLCNDHPDKFKTVDTSYGRALELVTWDTILAKTLPSPDVQSLGLIVDRPLKFKQLRLRKGLNLKRRHQDFLLKFGEIPDVCPYRTPATELVKESIEAEKRACAVVREVLGMTVEKRTLIDHLTHFRKEFGLSNKLRGMIIRHPELFYVSLKGQRDSVLLVEGYDEKGILLERDKSLEIREQLMQLVREGKRMRRERKRAWINGTEIGDTNDDQDDEYKEDDHNDDEDDDYDDDGFENLFESKYSDLDDDHDESSELSSYRDNAEFWTTHLGSFPSEQQERSLEPW